MQFWTPDEAKRYHVVRTKTRQSIVRNFAKREIREDEEEQISINDQIISVAQNRMPKCVFSLSDADVFHYNKVRPLDVLDKVAAYR